MPRQHQASRQSQHTVWDVRDLGNYPHCLKLYKTRAGKSMAGCDYLRLTRPDLREYSPHGTPPPIKYPEAPAEPANKPGLTWEQYFNSLCEKEPERPVEMLSS